MEDTQIGMEKGRGQKFVDGYWGAIMNIKRTMGRMRFSALEKVTVAGLSLPYNNADCERAFSVVRKVYTESHQSHNADTLTALLQCKLG